MFVFLGFGLVHGPTKGTMVTASGLQMFMYIGICIYTYIYIYIYRERES